MGRPGAKGCLRTIALRHCRLDLRVRTANYIHCASKPVVVRRDTRDARATGNGRDRVVEKVSYAAVRSLL